jgi:hypothetical protein
VTLTISHWLADDATAERRTIQVNRGGDMGRIRTIKPEFFTHEELSALDAETHLFAAGLLCYSDDFGYFNANPKLAAAAVFPIRESSSGVPEIFRRLREIGFICLGYTPDGKQWGKIAKFGTHQRVSHPTPSKIKDLPIKWQDYGTSPEEFVSLPETFVPEGNREQGTGNREGEARPLPSPLKKELSDAGSELMAANWLLEELCIPADNGVRKVAAESIRMLAKEGGTIEDATRYIFEAGRQAIADGETITRFWFSDQKYKPQTPVKSKRAKQQEAVWKEFHERNKDDDED